MKTIPGLFLLVLSGCATTAATTEPVGELRHAGQSYLLRKAPGGTGNWQVLVGDRPVACSAPTSEACYWSLRAYLNEQDLLDEM